MVSILVAVSSEIKCYSGSIIPFDIFALCNPDFRDSGKCLP